MTMPEFSPEDTFPGLDRGLGAVEEIKELIALATCHGDRAIQPSIGPEESPWLVFGDAAQRWGYPDIRVAVAGVRTIVDGLPEKERGLLEAFLACRNAQVDLAQRRAESAETWAASLVASVVDAEYVEGLLREAARRDTLTGVLSKKGLDDWLDNEFLGLTPGQYRREHDIVSLENGRRILVGYCDLTKFKRVNDWLGHAVGDRIIVAGVKSVQGVLRDGDVLAHPHGDEIIFAIAEPDDDLVKSLWTRLHDDQLAKVKDGVYAQRWQKIFDKIGVIRALAGPDATKEEQAVAVAKRVKVMDIEGPDGVPEEWVVIDDESNPLARTNDLAIVGFGICTGVVGTREDFEKLLEQSDARSKAHKEEYLSPHTTGDPDR
jgi:diguanylate cyclase (GGDEF)-like protein